MCLPLASGGSRPADGGVVHRDRGRAGAVGAASAADVFSDQRRRVRLGQSGDTQAPAEQDGAHGHDDPDQPLDRLKLTNDPCDIRHRPSIASPAAGDLCAGWEWAECFLATIGEPRSCMLADVNRRRRWQAPPEWPAVPSGWSPPAGWQPDPSWPAAPPDWVWWVKAPELPRWKPPLTATMIGGLLLVEFLVIWRVTLWAYSASASTNTESHALWWLALLSVISLVAGLLLGLITVSGGGRHRSPPLFWSGGGIVAVAFVASAVASSSQPCLGSVCDIAGAPAAVETGFALAATMLPTLTLGYTVILGVHGRLRRSARGTEGSSAGKRS
jgi:hypothetical protein